MLQATLGRLRGRDHAAPIVVCNEEHRFLVAEQCRSASIDAEAIVLEPEGRNTAPAIGLAARVALERDDDAVLLVMPSDHVIKEVPKFHVALDIAAVEARAGKIATFGVVPTDAHTGYGYIEVGDALASGARAIHSFVEKPSEALAKKMLANSSFLWNSGIFLFRARVFLEELAAFRGDIASAVETSFENGSHDLDFFRPGAEFLDCPEGSIDYTVMEKTSSACVVPADFTWSDVGSWSSLWEALERDKAGNARRGDVIDLDTTNSLLLAHSRLLVSIGLDDTIVVETPDAVLVAAKDHVQKVKDVVETLKTTTREEPRSHVEVYRPWGQYEALGTGLRYQIKRIKVAPGASLSLQLHHHRSEHWIVVQGTGHIRRGDDEFILSENESTYIPVGVRHRLSNPGKLPLELIEVQVGAYLGEDDIVRFDDSYGRD